MNLDELRSVQAKERRKDSLQHLRDAFYDDVAAYIADLRAARDQRAESVENPFEDDDVRRMSDEIETAEEVSEALYERRVGKVVKLASFAAADMPVEREGMTSQERDLFVDLVARIEQNKSEVLDVLAGEAPPASEGVDASPASEEPRTDSVTDAEPTPSTDETPVSSTDTARGTDSDSTRERSAEDPTADDAIDSDGGVLADAMGTSTGTDENTGSTGDTEETTEPTPVAPEQAPPGAASREDQGESGGESLEDDTDTAVPASDSGETSASAERTTVKITRDVGEILGVDEREYDLSPEDVVTLPSQNAEPLIQRDAAERID